MTTTPTPETEHLIQLRAYHANELRRIDDALALLKDIRRRAKATARVVEKVRSRALSDHPLAVRSRMYRARGTSDNPAAVAPSRHRQQRNARTRPIDLIRQMFAAAGDRVVMPETILSDSGIATLGLIGGPEKGPGESANRRVLGLALTVLRKNREIEKRGDGYVARKLRLVDTNGASAETRP